MRLFITAKQSVARAIGSALAGKTRELERREDHFYIARTDGQVDRIAWCGGHLVEMAPPESYNDRYRKWRLEDLPVIPENWKSLGVDPHKYPGQARQLAFIRHVLPQASVVVHAGDPDREGQWLIDEVLTFCDYSGPVQRLLLMSLNWSLMRSAIKAFEQDPPDNQLYLSWSIAARTRARMDWLYGMNMTRAYTLLGKHAGYEEVLSVGRVQTPLLGLVVKRDESIENFVPEYRYSLEAKFRKSETYCHAILQDNKITGDKKSLELLAKKLRGMFAKLEAREQQHHFQSPPLLLDLESLQMECSEIFGYSGVEVIRIAKSLYEDFHLITYPLTNCRYAPEKKRDEADLVIEVISENISIHKKILKSVLKNADIWRKSCIWDNSKITHHHGIMPTAHKADAKKMEEKHWNVYILIARYYLSQFFPDAETLEEEFIFCLGDYHFNAHKISVIENGWKAVMPDDKIEQQKLNDFPDWKINEDLICEDINIKRYKTLPPCRFTEATLISAMKHITPFIKNGEILQRLHSTEGIGTSVTRAHMIDTLFKRGYLIKGNKSIFSSGVGRDLIRALPEEAKSVDMTALWEQELYRIEKLPARDADEAAKNLIIEVENCTRNFISEAQQKKNIEMHSPDEVLNIKREKKHYCPRCHSVLVLRNGRYGSFWGCSAYPGCEYTSRWID